MRHPRFDARNPEPVTSGFRPFKVDRITHMDRDAELRAADDLSVFVGCQRPSYDMNAVICQDVCEPQPGGSARCAQVDQLAPGPPPGFGHGATPLTPNDRKRRAAGKRRCTTC